MGPDWLDRSHSVASAGYNRWLVPPAALCIHLAIGQAYAFSVFTKPMAQLIGVTASAPGDWTVSQLGWIFSLAIVLLGLSAAFGGRWVEEVGPRKAMSLRRCASRAACSSPAAESHCTRCGWCISATAWSAELA